MLPIEGTSPESVARWVNAQDANCTPWSEWMTAPAGGVRVWMAIPKALVTSAGVGWRRSGRAWHGATWPAGQPGQPSAAHQQGHRVVADHDPATRRSSAYTRRVP